MKAKIAR